MRSTSTRPSRSLIYDDRWGVKEILNPEQQRERLASLLCYLGALTIEGKQTDSKIILEIPNLVMRKLYAERILNLTFPTADERDEAKVSADTFFAQGDIALYVSLSRSICWPSTATATINISMN